HLRRRSKGDFSILQIILHLPAGILLHLTATAFTPTRFLFCMVACEIRCTASCNRLLRVVVMLPISGTRRPLPDFALSRVTRVAYKNKLPILSANRAVQPTLIWHGAPLGLCTNQRRKSLYLPW